MSCAIPSVFYTVIQISKDGQHMPKFLIVEDSSVILKILKHIAKQELPFDVLFASSMAQAKALYLEHKDEVVAGLIDLALPDAPDGQLVDYLLEEGLPVVVLTGTSDGDTAGMPTDPVGADWTTLPGNFKRNGYFVTGTGKTFHPGDPYQFDYPYSWSFDEFPYGFGGGPTKGHPEWKNTTSDHIWCNNTWNASAVATITIESSIRILP